MCPRKCPERASILRSLAGFVVLSFLAALLAGAPRQEAFAAQAVILPPDAAARAFSQGRDALKRGETDSAIRFLQQAIETGHDRPAARLGTNRYFVERYDPYYWLGVAWMQKGDKDRAREALQKSAAFGLIQQWPEGADLGRRLQELDPRPIPATPSPTATSVPPTPVVLPIETAPPVEPQQTATPTPTSTPGPALTPSPSPAGPITIPSPLSELPPEFREELLRVLEAAAKADWSLADSRLRALRSRYPGQPQPALIQAVVLGSRYLLEGGKDERLRRSARDALLEFRRTGGTAKQEGIWLSPSLAAALSY